MMRFLIRVLIFIASAALGLWAASLLLEDFVIHIAGFVIATAIFAIVQSLLQPIMVKLTAKYANTLTGGVGLLTTFLALLITTLVSDGLEITGVTTWLLATLIVWLVTAVAAQLLPKWWLKDKEGER